MPVMSHATAGAAAKEPATAPATHNRKFSDARTCAMHKQIRLCNSVAENVGPDYQITKAIGEGAYGSVVAGKHLPTGQRVAIKSVQPFTNRLMAIRTFREIQLLRYFREQDACQHIVVLLDVVHAPTYSDFDRVYLVQELMETDLNKVLRSQVVTEEHAAYFTWQILCALKATHSADVLHRDLKPSNLLINSNCDLKVCDFGLSRSVLTAENPDANGGIGFMSEYVATRWYRAPEIMLTFRQYTKAIDIWATGVILAEILLGRPLFPGKDYHNQMMLTLNVVGTPMVKEMYPIRSKRSREYLSSMPICPRASFRQLFAGASPEALDFLEHTLQFDPLKRMTVEQALSHPFVQGYHTDQSEVAVPSLPQQFFHLDLKKDVHTEEVRQELWNQVGSYPRLL